LAHGDEGTDMVLAATGKESGSASRGGAITRARRIDRRSALPDVWPAATRACGLGRGISDTEPVGDWGPAHVR